VGSQKRHLAARQGGYLTRAILDFEHRLATDPVAPFDSADFYAQVELKHACWRGGFRQAVTFSRERFPGA